MSIDISVNEPFTAWSSIIQAGYVYSQNITYDGGSIFYMGGVAGGYPAVGIFNISNGSYSYLNVQTICSTYGAGQLFTGFYGSNLCLAGSSNLVAITTGGSYVSTLSTGMSSGYHGTSNRTGGVFTTQANSSSTVSGYNGTTKIYNGAGGYNYVTGIACDASYLYICMRNNSGNSQVSKVNLSTQVSTELFTFSGILLGLCMDENYMYGMVYSSNYIAAYDLNKNTFNLNAIRVLGATAFQNGWGTSLTYANSNIWWLGQATSGWSIYNVPALIPPYPAKPTITVTSTFTYITINFTTTRIGYGATSITSCSYSLNGGTTYITATPSANSVQVPLNSSNYGKTYNINITITNNNSLTSSVSNTVSITIPYYPCFAKNTQILTADGYTPVQKLHPGDMIQTVRHGFVPLWKLGKKTIYHPASKDRLSHQLYRLSPDRYTALTEPLVITGCHSILVEEWSSDQEKDRAAKVHEGKVYITDDRYRLPACADEKAEVHEPAGEYTIYHVALENPDYLMNYGIYANGLLVESCSKRYLVELSGMKLLK